MIFLTFVAIIAFIFGLLFLFFPSQLKKLNDSSNRVFANIDDKLFKYRIGAGISLILVAILCFFITNYIKLK
jgi:uncharacterized BrkB/YihY/UPF0761 family membrane protein